MNTQKLLTIAALSIAFVLVLVEMSLADVPTDNAIQSIMDTYRNTAANWSPVLEGYATRIFWILALIDIVWMGIMLALNPGEFADFTANLVRKVIFIGFFFSIIAERDHLGRRNCPVVSPGWWSGQYASRRYTQCNTRSYF